MNTLLFVIMLVGIGSISVASLAPAISDLWVQELGTFDIEELAPKCNCLNSFSPGFDPDDPSTHDYGPQYCLTDPNDPDMVLGDDNMICTWEYHGAYGDEYKYQGCDSKFWKTHANPKSANYLWPPGYEPDMKFNEIFLTNIAVAPDGSFFLIDNIELDKIKEYKEKYKRYLKNMEHLIEEGKINDRTSMALKWILNSFPDDKEKKFLQIAKSKLDGFEKRMEILVKKKHLQSEDRDYILRVGHHFFVKDPSLIDVLKHGHSSTKGPLNEFAAESVSSLLNSAHGDVKYKYRVVEVIDMAGKSITGGQYGTTLTEFRMNNNLGGSPLCS